MGTSQKLKSSVKGNPNWGDVSGALSNLANVISKGALNPGLSSNQRFSDRKNSGARKVVSSYAKAQGGSSSHSGRAAVRNASRLGGFLYSTLSNGFSSYLNERGFGQLLGKSKNDVVNFLLENICEAATNINESAAKSALGQLLDKLLIDAENAIDIETVLKGHVERDGIENILIDYFSYYIFEDIYQRLEEKLFDKKNRDNEICNSTFNEIKDFIHSELQVINQNNSLNNISWADDNERENLVESIFIRTINVFE